MTKDIHDMIQSASIEPDSASINRILTICDALLQRIQVLENKVSELTLENNRP